MTVSFPYFRNDANKTYEKQLNVFPHCFIQEYIFIFLSLKLSKAPTQVKK